MSDKKTFLMLLCGMMTMMMYPVVVCMEQNKEIISYKDIAKNILVGSCTGVAEVIVNQPLIYFKNMLQQGKRISLNPKIAYRGLGVGVACMAPTTAVQFGVEKGLQNIFPGAETIPTTLRSVSAGAFSALVSSPTELIVLHQQNSGMHSWKTIRTLVGQEGICVLSRGMLAKSLRDSVFCTGLLSLYPMLEQKISADVVNNKPIATITAGVI